MRRFSGLVIALLLLLAFPASQADEVLGREDRVETYVAGTFAGLLGSTAAELRGLAPIVSEDTRVSTHPFDAEAWLASTLIEFDGMSVRFAEVSDEPLPQVLSIRLMKSHEQFHQYSYVDSLPDIYALLGVPDIQDIAEITFFGHSTTLRFLVDGDEVVGIEVAFHWC